MSWSISHGDPDGLRLPWCWHTCLALTFSVNHNRMFLGIFLQSFRHSWTCVPSRRLFAEKRMHVHLLCKSDEKRGKTISFLKFCSAITNFLVFTHSKRNRCLSRESRSLISTLRNKLPKTPANAFGKQMQPFLIYFFETKQFTNENYNPSNIYTEYLYFTFSCSWIGPFFSMLMNCVISSLISSSSSSKRRPNPKSLRFLKVYLRCSCHAAPSVKNMPS